MTEESFTPENGDIILVKTPAFDIISIFKKFDYFLGNKIIITYCHMFFKNGYNNIRVNSYHDNGSIRLVNEEEKTAFLDELNKNGLEWDSKSKILIRKKWPTTKSKKYQTIIRNVEAIKYDGTNIKEIEDFAIKFFKKKFYFLDSNHPSMLRIYRTGREDSFNIFIGDYMVIVDKKLSTMTDKQFKFLYYPIQED